MSQHLVITGANGFIGRALVSRLRRERRLGVQAVGQLTLIDLTLDEAPQPLLHLLPGRIDDAALLDRAFAQPVDTIFHLASIPGGSAEQQYRLARDVNLLGTQALLERGQAQVASGGAPPVVVFASSVAVYGCELPAQVDEHTPAQPQLSYGAHKLIGEILLADFSRRGWVDGRSLRLPGVLARPPQPTGQLSAFLSEVFWRLAAGEAFTCPTSPQAHTWAASVHATVDNLLQAAQIDADHLPAHRWLLQPALHFSMGALVDALGTLHGPAAAARVRWMPDARIEALFGRYPPLHTPLAEALGLRHDGDLPTLVRRATLPT